MMFDVFNGPTRQALVAAYQVAIEAGGDEIDDPELLIGLLRVQDEKVAALLDGHEVTLDALTVEFDRARRRGGITDQDAAALSTLGVNVDEVMRSVEQTVGAAALAQPVRRRRRRSPRFTPEARQTIMQTLRESMRRAKTRDPGPEHLLLALLSGHSVAADALTTRGVTYDGVVAKL
ncbi:Clp protease N-terminal domain-containing protein [Kibdelosporangium lantanae]